MTEYVSKCHGLPVRQWAKIQGAISTYILYRCLGCGKTCEVIEKPLAKEEDMIELDEDGYEQLSRKDKLHFKKRLIGIMTNPDYPQDIRKKADNLLLKIISLETEIIGKPMAKEERRVSKKEDGDFL